MNPQWTPWKIFLSVCAVLVVILPLFLVGQIVETLGAGEIMVIQSPVSGKLAFHTTPGLKAQWFGTVTKYKRRAQFWFSSKIDQGKKEDESLKIRFNDGAGANVSGSIAWEMPLDEEHLTLLHTKYGSQEGVEHQLIRTVMEKAIYMTGPLMSSTESYAERRNELLTLIEEQAVNGIYATETHTVTVTDELTRQSRTKNVVRLRKDDKGMPMYADHSPLKEYGVRTSNLSINTVKYDPIVEDQIKKQQEQLGAVQIAIAGAKKAEQDAITAEQTGKANAATAKWEQEKLNAKEIALAEKDKKVAELAAEKEKQVARLAKESAEFTKEQQILLGQGESERRRLVLAADNALDAKLAAYVKVAEVTAKALGDYKGNWVPTIVLGGTGSTGNDQTATGAAGAHELIQMLLAKTAKDLALDMNVSAAPKTK